MQVTALAEVLMDWRQSDGAFSLQDLQLRLSRVGLEEFARAAASLWKRLDAPNQKKDGLEAHPWMS